MISILTINYPPDHSHKAAYAGWIPYVTSGSSIIKEEIRKTPRTANEYPINSLGLEGLSLEWIVKSLKRGGRAFLIIPDGILSRVGGKKLRDYILHECYLDAVVSLPDRTFFANFERTYIIAFTKKNDPADKQTDPVFTYLASEIGEKLTSVRREEIDKDDMPQMEALFRIFNAAKTSTKSVVEGMSGRCKIQAFSRFRDESHWVVDRWWTQDERIAVGADSAIKIASKGDLDKQKDYLTALLSDYSSFISADPLAGASAKEVVLGDTTLFEIFIGKRVLRKDVTKDTTKIPVYSANVVTPMGYIETSNVKNFNNSTLLWGIDGNFDFNLIPSGQKFATTDHCGAIQVLDPAIHPDYVLYALHVARVGESFDRAFRASLTNMRKFVLRIPTKANGSFDLAMQKKIATRFAEMQSKISGLKTAKAGFDDIFNRYIASTA